MAASLQKSANSLKVSWAPLHMETRGILIEFKDVDEELMEWIIMPKSSSSSMAFRGISKPALNQVEFRGIPEDAFNAHQFEATVYGCQPQVTPGTRSSYLVTQSHRATFSTRHQDEDLERLFNSRLRLASSRTASSSYHGVNTLMLYSCIR